MGKISSPRFLLIGAVTGAALFAATFGLALFLAREPDPCTDGLELFGERCCAPGQSLVGGRCWGLPKSCPDGMALLGGEAPGCVARSWAISYTGGQVVIAPTDWDSEQVERETFSVAPFRLDSHEVTWHRYFGCPEGNCAALEGREPGAPVTRVTAAEAERFCRSAGGRLPSPEEWMFASMGEQARRYPWGAHGLTCRRAAYGLERGPCGTTLSSPELAGARSLGRSPEGAEDLVGNVRELTRDASGRIFLVGGSFRSRFPAEVKSWARVPHSGAPQDDVGFRCAYEVE
ncbi:MAG: hypothetical protein B6A08_09115 [Sorangiineae bacterium NIC37A_2]|nr:MAG: hypothetical protein B6A08_09115 [Sorangiineae bacterium NIC37A_2]